MDGRNHDEMCATDKIYRHGIGKGCDHEACCDHVVIIDDANVTSAWVEYANTRSHGAAAVAATSLMIVTQDASSVSMDENQLSVFHAVITQCACHA
jgi:hypothetical protein